MAAHSSIPAWRTPWTEEPGGLRSMGSQRVDTTETNTCTFQTTYFQLDNSNYLDLAQGQELCPIPFSQSQC